MRVNIYAEELTDRIEIISKLIEGHQFTALRFYLELPATITDQSQATDMCGDPIGPVSHHVRNVRGPFIHRPGDDDSSAVTFWGKQDLRILLVKAIELLDKHYEAQKLGD